MHVLLACQALFRPLRQLPAGARIHRCGHTVARSYLASNGAPVFVSPCRSLLLDHSRLVFSGEYDSTAVRLFRPVIAPRRDTLVPPRSGVVRENDHQWREPGGARAPSLCAALPIAAPWHTSNFYCGLLARSACNTCAGPDNSYCKILGWKTSARCCRAFPVSHFPPTR